MKILHVTNNDSKGGAARAAYRMHQWLNDAGVDSQMLVARKYQNDPATYTSRYSARIQYRINRLEQIPLDRYKNRTEESWSVNWMPSPTLGNIQKIKPDIVHLHWLGQGLIPIRDVGKLQQPVVWSLHDSWAFTGGCHIPYDCKRYQDSCGNCPQLQSGRDNDLSRKVWNAKSRRWADLNLTIITPSRWLAECARSSSLFKNTRIEVIPWGLDTKFYKPLDKSFAREALGLPQDKKLILFGAVNSIADRNKGFHLLQAAVQHLYEQEGADFAELVVFGADQPKEPIELGFQAHYLGTLQDKASLALAYSAADVMVVPSISENFALTALEAMACATPCVGFRIGGIPDLIEHLRTGYMATPYDTEELAQGIKWVLNGQRNEILSKDVQKIIVQEYNSDLMIERFIGIYNSLL